MESELELRSLTGVGSAVYQWPNVSNDEKEMTNEIIETIRLVCQEEEKDQEMPELRSALDDILREEYDIHSYQSMKSVCDRYNQTVEKILRRHAGTRGSRRLRRRPSVKLLRHVLQQCYNRAVVDPDKLNQYEPFSAEVYGETSFELVDQMINTIEFTENDRFIDLGSGVGQVVLQVAAATNCSACYGIEKANWPAQYAEQMTTEFRRWMDFYGKIYSKFELIKGDFLSEEHRDTIHTSTVIFVNNFAFGPLVDHELKDRFHDLREGTKIVSSKAFCALNMHISERNLSDIGAILTVEELSPLRGPVSWTPKQITYYLHTVDRTLLEHFFKMRQNGCKAVHLRKDRHGRVIQTGRRKEYLVDNYEKLNKKRLRYRRLLLRSSRDGQPASGTNRTIPGISAEKENGETRETDREKHLRGARAIQFTSNEGSDRNGGQKLPPHSLLENRNAIVAKKRRRRLEGHVEALRSLKGSSYGRTDGIAEAGTTRGRDGDANGNVVDGKNRENDVRESTEKEGEDTKHLGRWLFSIQLESSLAAVAMTTAESERRRMTTTTVPTGRCPRREREPILDVVSRNFFRDGGGSSAPAPAAFQREEEEKGNAADGKNDPAVVSRRIQIKNSTGNANRGFVRQRLQRTSKNERGCGADSEDFPIGGEWPSCRKSKRSTKGGVSAKRIRLSSKQAKDPVVDGRSAEEETSRTGGSDETSEDSHDDLIPLSRLNGLQLEPCSDDDDFEDEEIDGALYKMYEEMTKISDDKVSRNTESFNVRWLRDEARSFVVRSPISPPNTEPVSMSSDGAATPPFDFYRQTDVDVDKTLQLSSWLSADQTLSESKLEDFSWLPSLVEPSVAVSPIFVSLPRGETTPANNPVGSSTSLTPVSRRNVAAKETLHSILEREAASIDDVSVSLSIPISLPRALTGEPSVGLVSAEDRIARGDDDDESVVGTREYVRHSVTERTIPRFENSVPIQGGRRRRDGPFLDDENAAGIPVRCKLENCSDDDDDDVPASLHVLMESFKMQYVTYLRRMRSNDYRQQIVTQIQSEQRRKDYNLSVVESLDQQVAKLENEGKVLLTTRSSEVGIVASDSRQFVDEANHLILRHQLLEMQAEQLNCQLESEQQKLFQNWQEFCREQAMTSLLARNDVNLVSVYDNSERRFQLSLPTAGRCSSPVFSASSSISISPFTDSPQSVLDTAILMSDVSAEPRLAGGLDERREDTSSDVESGGGRLRGDAMPRLNVSVEHYKDGPAQSGSVVVVEDEEDTGRTGSPEIDMPLLMPELEPVLSCHQSRVSNGEPASSSLSRDANDSVRSEGSGVRVSVPVRLPLRKLRGTRKPEGLTIVIPTSDATPMDVVVSSPAVPASVSTPQTRRELSSGEMTNMYSPISRPSSAGSGATVRPRNEVVDAVMAASCFSPISSPGSVRSSSTSGKMIIGNDDLDLLSSSCLPSFPLEDFPWTPGCCPWGILPNNVSAEASLAGISQFLAAVDCLETSELKLPFREDLSATTDRRSSGGRTDPNVADDDEVTESAKRTRNSCRKKTPKTKSTPNRRNSKVVRNESANDFSCRNDRPQETDRTWKTEDDLNSPVDRRSLQIAVADDAKDDRFRRRLNLVGNGGQASSLLGSRKCSDPRRDEATDYPTRLCERNLVATRPSEGDFGWMRQDFDDFRDRDASKQTGGTAEDVASAVCGRIVPDPPRRRRPGHDPSIQQLESRSDSRDSGLGKDSEMDYERGASSATGTRRKPNGGGASSSAALDSGVCSPRVVQHRSTKTSKGQGRRPSAPLTIASMDWERHLSSSQMLSSSSGVFNETRFYDQRLIGDGADSRQQNGRRPQSAVASSSSLSSSDRRRSGSSLRSSVCRRPPSTGFGRFQPDYFQPSLAGFDDRGLRYLRNANYEDELSSRNGVVHSREPLGHFPMNNQPAADVAGSAYSNVWDQMDFRQRAGSPSGSENARGSSQIPGFPKFGRLPDLSSVCGSSMWPSQRRDYRLERIHPFAIAAGQMPPWMNSSPSPSQLRDARLFEPVAASFDGTNDGDAMWRNHRTATNSSFSALNPFSVNGFAAAPSSSLSSASSFHGLPHKQPGTGGGRVHQTKRFGYDLFRSEDALMNGTRHSNAL